MQVAGIGTRIWGETTMYFARPGTIEEGNLRRWFHSREGAVDAALGMTKSDYPSDHHCIECGVTVSDPSTWIGHRPVHRHCYEIRARAEISKG